MKLKKSIALFTEAQKHIPGGVNSPVRAFKSVGGDPIFMAKAKGAYLYDADGNKYIDYIGSWGPMILGHAHKDVVKAVRSQIRKSSSYGTPTALEVLMAGLLSSNCPNVDKIRMVNSGTEACMSALRVARGYTGKNKFIKFAGNYHGHADAFLVNAGSGVATLGIQAIPGVTASVAADTLSAEYNNIEVVKKLVEENRGEIAAIILEPVAGNMGCIPPSEDFLQGLRTICDEENIVLIFDEVMTGFRLAFGGAQELYGVHADLVTYGKIIGGGMPVGAFGGKEEIMNMVAPVGKVYQGGTLSGNPIAMIAGHTTLSILQQNPEIYTSLETKTEYLAAGLYDAFAATTYPVCINRVGSMLSLHFGTRAVENFEDASAADNTFFNKFFHHMLSNGVYLPPSAFETWFLSDAISYKDLNKTIKLAKKFAKKN